METHGVSYMDLTAERYWQRNDDVIALSYMAAALISRALRGHWEQLSLGETKTKTGIPPVVSMAGGWLISYTPG